MATSTPAELAAAIGWGAVGATCNQVIALATNQMPPRSPLAM